MESDNFLHIVHILHSFGTGGMEKGLATVINNSSSDLRHTIICLTESGASKQLLQKNITIIEMNKKKGNSLFFIFRLMMVLRQLKPDIVHTRNWGGFDGVIAARLAGISHIIHGEHGWSMDDPDGLNPRRVFIRRILNLFIKKYTCVSMQMKAWLEKDIRVGKDVIQIYNGVDCNLFCPGNDEVLKSELGIAPETIVMGIVARLDPIKNHAGLIKAFNRVHKKNPHTCLLIIGEGPERPKLEKISSSRVLFLGNRSDVCNLLKCIDIFILSSFNEGISNTILEAMASGLPVIASDVGGNPELVKDGENGFLVPPHDYEQMADRIVKYIAEPHLVELHGKTGREQAVRNFSIASMVNDYESVYRTARG